MPRGPWERAWISLRRRDVLGRIVLGFLAAAAMSVILRAWDPPLRWRSGMVPRRDVTAGVTFSREDAAATEAARQQARRNAPAVFVQDSAPLVRLRATLRATIAELAKAEALGKSEQALWREFESPPPQAAAPARAAEDNAGFQEFRKAVAGKENLDQLDRAVAEALAPFEHRGLLGDPRQELAMANPEEILVYPLGHPELKEPVQVKDVQLGDASGIRESLLAHVQPEVVAQHVFLWFQAHLLRPKPMTTLARDKEATDQSQAAAADGVKPVWQTFNAREPLLDARKPIGKDTLDLLGLEHAAFLAQRGIVQQVTRFAAVLLLVFVLFLLCGVYMRYQRSGPLASVGQLAGLLLLAVGTVALARTASLDPWRAELVPLMLFGMTMAIVYRQELALLLSGVLAWIIVVAAGYGLSSFLLLFGATAAAALSLGRIRSRSKLVYVGLFAGGVAVLLDLALEMIDNQSIDLAILEDAARNGLCAVAAGFLMTGLLPFIERAFGVLTDLSLLELGDITHPLLQEMVRRAPSTYNHSVTVGSIGEAAADAIGARGLLVRVGAYFHDIGKILKPGYFVENQGEEGSRHETLVPAMSTLIIVAHIKDGADLARQHRLPQPIIDLVLQHHGTTLVEYFYDRAHEQKESDPNGGEVDENLFRYPGPKPQTKEAAVLMLADAVESASRTLVDPTPARIESLVGEIAQHRLQGGQFDDSGLTLRELGTIERSLVMSVAAIYHARLKYPEQRTA
ncbi:MAG: HDIG domain-containing metalloprotein [Thermoguttaceae bacterium]